MNSWVFLSRRLLIGVLLFCLCFSSFSAVPSRAAPSTPKIAWSPCYRDLGPFECGTVQVPLDYSQPDRAAISIAMVRLPASDQAHKIGSVFLNPGGPGGSGFDFALQIGPYLAWAGLGAQFDIVGFDPRGIYRSTALKCFGNTKQYLEIQPPFVFPYTSEQELVLKASQDALVSACDQRAGRIMDHMTTADVVRDLDLLRQAVGDEQLSYMGFSYGSYLGVTYANLFPDRVRALVVDAVLDPIGWATGYNGEGTTVPLPTRLREYVDSEATLAEFFRLCDAGGPNCAFAPNAAARFNQLADRLKAAPVFIPMPDGTTIAFTYDILIVYTLQSMYTASTWPDLANLLAALEYFASPAEVGQQLQALREDLGLTTKRGIPNYVNYEGQMAVACSDTDNPLDFAVWAEAAHTTGQQYPIFGSIWTWIWSTCSTWPGPAASRYTGPFTANTANPVLVVGSTYDPATPYQGAVTVHDLLPNSALLTVDGWGHGSITMSTCALMTELNYLITGATPPEGARCAADVVPFAGPPVSVLERDPNSPAFDLNGVFLPDFLKRYVP